MNEGLGELKCRRHFVPYIEKDIVKNIVKNDK